MIYTMKTNKTLAEIKKEVVFVAKENAFGVLKEYEFKQLLKEKGFPIERKITVYELCNPKVASEALDIYPEVSSFLPCRLSIYETDGATVISTIDMERILESFTGMDAELKEHLHQIYINLKNVILGLI